MVQKLAETMGKHRQISAMPIVLTGSRTENKIENTDKIGFQSYCLWPWEKINISTGQIN